MIASQLSVSRASTPENLHAAFLSILPRIQRHGHVYFRHLSHQKKEDALAEMIALSWQWFVRLAKKGKDATQFASALASYAARAVRSGRRLIGIEKAKDVLSPLSQRQYGFVIQPIPDGRSLLDEALLDNTQTPIPEQVSFRCDFPAWRSRRCDRDRQVIDALMTGERTRDVADKHGLTAARVSQLRREFSTDWQKFCGEPAPDRTIKV